MINNPQTAQIQTVSILGCGWFGLALAQKLIQLSYRVKGSTTSQEKIGLLADYGIKPYLINFTGNQAIAESSFFDADALFICIPPKRNSAELQDYPKKIAAILTAAGKSAKKIILISSTSVYGDGNETVDENSETFPDTDSGRLVLQAEQVLQTEYPEDFTIIRFAGLIGPNRNPGRFFAGKTDIPNGLAPVNLIHQIDAVGVAVALLEKQAFGRIYNACAPAHPSKMDFYTQAAKESDLALPLFIPEKVSWKIVDSVHLPKFLNYPFIFNVDLAD